MAPKERRHAVAAQAGAKSVVCDATPEMISAAVRALWELEGEVSKEALAKAVWKAMIEIAPSPRLGST